jgi:3-polyprenyl-4-hydroxybenzoate decarboxylase
MKIAAYYRPPKQVSDIDNKLFKEEINRLGIKRKKDILIFEN